MCSRTSKSKTIWQISPHGVPEDIFLFILNYAEAIIVFLKAIIVTGDIKLVIATIALVALTRRPASTAATATKLGDVVSTGILDLLLEQCNLPFHRRVCPS